MNWIPDDERTAAAGDAPAGAARPAGAAPGPAQGATGGEAGGESPASGPPTDLPPTPSQAGGLPDLSPVALAAGLVGLLAGPALVADPTARYVILVADLVALAFGALGVWVSLRRFARLDYAVAAIVMGGISLFLWVSYVTDPPQGGT